MWRSFTNKVDMNTFNVRPCNVDLKEKNVVRNKYSALSNTLNFSAVDLVPDQTLNEILWKFVKGEKSVCPSPTRAAFFKESKQDKD
jgi:hypothetical protein